MPFATGEYPICVSSPLSLVDLNGRCGTRPLNWQDLPGSQRAGPHSPRHCCRFACFPCMLALHWCIERYVCEHFHVIQWRFPWQRYSSHLFSAPRGRGLVLSWEGSLPETHWGTRSETRAGHRGLAASLCIRFSCLLRPDRKWSTSSFHDCSRPPHSAVAREPCQKRNWVTYRPTKALEVVVFFVFFNSVKK